MWILAQEEKRGNDRIFITGHNGHLSGPILPGVCLCYKSSAHKMSAADIGKVVGMSRFAVHRRLKEGLALLKKELA